MKEKTSARGGSASGRKKQISYWLSVIVIGVALGLGLQFVRAWTEPSTAPPGGNVGAPINTSGNYQAKSGGLSVLGGVNTTGLSASSYVSTPWVYSTNINNSGGIWSNSISASSYISTPWVYSTNINNSGGIYSGSYVQAPIFYDANDSGYYVDPNRNSRMDALYSNNITNYGQITNNGDINSAGRVCSAYGGWRCLDNVVPSCTCRTVATQGNNTWACGITTYMYCPGWSGWWTTSMMFTYDSCYAANEYTTSVPCY